MGTGLQRRLFPADEYHRMAEAGVLGPEDRVELVDGEIVLPAAAFLVSDILGGAE